MKPDTSLRLEVQGETMSGKVFTKTVMLTVGHEETPEERLEGVGIVPRTEEGKVFIDNVLFASAAEKAGLEWDQEILSIQVPTDVPPKEILYLPTLGLFAAIWLVQFRRRKRLEGQAQPA